MPAYEEEIKKLLLPLFQDYGLLLIGANDRELSAFESGAMSIGLPEKAIIEMKKFYALLNGIDPSLDSLFIHKATDSMMYEFWNSNHQLWVGQRDMDMISWKEGKFHLGSAGNLNYGEEYIFENLLDLLKKGFSEWYPETNGLYPN